MNSHTLFSGRSLKYRQFLTLYFLIVTTLPCLAHDRILVVGDSWAAGVVGFKAFEQVFERRGIHGVEVEGSKTAIGGSRADQWATYHGGKLDILASELESHPTIDIVHLSIGGNDFLSYCLKNDIAEVTPEARQEKWNAIRTDIETIVRHIQAKRPGTRVLLCGYDTLDPDRIAQSYGLKAKGGPSTRAMNEALVEFARGQLDLAQSIDGFEFVQNFGLLQYHFGIEGHLLPKSVPLPGGAPDYIPFPGGNLDYGSGAAMPDGVHPTPEGYVILVQNCFDQFYGDWLNPGNGPNSLPLRHSLDH